MKLLEQTLKELGADTLKAFTIVPSFGGYFRGVKSISEYSPQKIVLKLRKTELTLTGDDMQVGKYFEEDIFVKGVIKEIKID